MGKKAASTKIDSVRHKDKRKNIPTEELRDFVSDDEQRPKTVLYPRDPSLDPQLVWKGKDEQDSKDLEVPAVPIYIQEKIHPQAIIEDFRRTAEKAPAADPDFGGLFADFNGLSDFGKKVDFYHHDQNWSNRMILGDSLLVMTSLAEKEGLKGRVQMIYIDPPYGISFRSNWQVSTRNRDIKDRPDDATRQPEQVRAFRDTWRMGIHTYLSYLRDRLAVARDLLSDSGTIVAQISDDNLHLVRSVLDEVFGTSNYAGTVAFSKTSSQSTTGIPSVVDYLLIYAKDKELQKLRPILQIKKPGERGAKQYTKIISPDMFEIRDMSEEEVNGTDPMPAGWEVCRLGPTTSQGFQKERSGPYTFQGEKIPIPQNLHWKYSPTPGGDMDKLAALGRLRRSGSGLATVLLAKDNPTTPLDNIWLDTGTGSFTEDQVYVVQTGKKVIERCVIMMSDPGDLILDPTMGSGTSAFVAEQWGRRWITIDTSRVAFALARSRLMTARFQYYVLADSAEGIAKEAEITGKARSASEIGNDIRKGFVYHRVPHVTPKSIANNPDIREGMTRKQIDDAIARHAETEILYDKPYDDPKRLRVTGPFTVESLSPHRTISVEQKKDAATTPTENGFTIKMLAGGSFTNMILENLKKAGVQNTDKRQRLKFDSIEPYPGEWICGEGRYAESDGKEKRAAICVGPEYGTVGPELVKEAAKEAVRGVGFDILIVCGFAFDPHVSEEAKRYGKLTVLAVRMNPDLAMGDELLKKTGAGNLFMVFGEPDLKIQTQKDGQIVVEIRGVDVYDPTTGEIRSNSTDDIACWFIDTDYNGESFFVRHAYFTGADEPYEKLKRALRAEINEGAWSQLYSTTSRPFPKPKSGKIAVKVINHYGDEVLKVYPIGSKK
ncbi:MAG TPA: site-specific DNA-methyltransferase [Tepidisphaeraceae bacterium]|nr:site-specific DNA-methyltransferase [Tepidisphaeraceae bacterium]